MLIHNLYQVPNIWQEYLCWSISFIFWVCHFLLHTEVKKPNFVGRMSADFENIGAFYISLEHFKSVYQQNCWTISFIFWVCHFLLHTEVKNPNFLGRMSADFENICSFYISLEHFKSVCQQNCWSISFEGECNFYTQ